VKGMMTMRSLKLTVAIALAPAGSPQRFPYPVPQKGKNT